nr:MAG: baseplate wedge [Lokiarchaeota virus Ratatoskr Meg22_1012]
MVSIVDIYGTGKRVIVKRDGTIDTDVTGSGDFRTSSGKENLINRIILRLMIRKGEIESDPEIGSDLYQLLGLPITALTKEWFKILTYDAIIRDPVVREVENIQVFEDSSIKGMVRITGSIIPVTEYNQVIDEAHDYIEGVSSYELDQSHVREITEAKGFVGNNLIYLIKNRDYIQHGDSIEFIGEIVPNGGFLVSYQYYVVSEYNDEPINFDIPYGGQ